MPVIESKFTYLQRKSGVPLIPLQIKMLSELYIFSTNSTRKGLAYAFYHDCGFRVQRWGIVCDCSGELTGDHLVYFRLHPAG